MAFLSCFGQQNYCHVVVCGHERQRARIHISSTPYKLKPYNNQPIKFIRQSIDEPIRRRNGACVPAFLPRAWSTLLLRRTPVVRCVRWTKVLASTRTGSFLMGDVSFIRSHSTSARESRVTSSNVAQTIQDSQRARRRQSNASLVRDSYSLDITP